MSVTHRMNKEERWPQGDLKSLDVLAQFLNTDFASLPAEKLRNYRFRWPDKWNHMKALESIRDVQAAIKGDLFPLAASQLRRDTEFWHDLLDKLNRMGLQRRWRMISKAGSGKDLLEKRVFRGWLFASNEKEHWYSSVASLLEAGDLNYLRICPVCRKYFAAKRMDGRFCSKACKETHDQKDAVNRVRKYRARKKARLLKKRDGERLRAFSSWVRSEIKTRIKHPWLDQIRKGSSIEKVFDSLTQKEKSDWD